jgi:hypothetical protein
MNNSNTIGYPAYHFGQFEDAKWVKALTEPFGKLAAQILRTYLNNYLSKGRSAANESLRKHHDSHVRTAAHRLLITHGMNSSEAASRTAKMFHDVKSLEHAKSIAEYRGLQLPSGLTPAGILKRCTDPDHWYRMFRAEEMRYRDQFARARYQTCARRELYVSDLAFRIYRERQEHSEEFLSNELLATSDQGDEIYVAELAKKSTSNPEIRRTELMVRARGMEDYSKIHQHICTFVSVTLPTEFHSSYEDSGRANPDYLGFTPKEGNEALLKRWQACRAELDRLNVRYYGLRVSEPHHDGCAHQHLWLFAESVEAIEILEATILKHFTWTLYVKRDTRNQVKFERIDKDKGSAAGYIAKYVSKNIDGHGLESEEASSAPRATAWARIWGIRQFDRLGGPPVAVWRHLRLQRSRELVPVSMREAWDAANDGDWCQFIVAMGGPFRGRNYPIKPDRNYKCSSITGDKSPTHNRWGEPLFLPGRYDLRPIVGLVCGADLMQTWQKFWRIERRLRTDNDPALADAGGVGAWSSDNNCTEL